MLSSECLFVRNVFPTKLQTLHQELEEMSKERTEEAAAAHARNLQNDRKIADMSATISRLQLNLRDTKRASFDDSRDSIYSSGEDDKAMQIKTLSEQVLRQQEMIGKSKSEISALKSRLQVAIRRADKVEGAMTSFQNFDDPYDRMENAPLSDGINDGRHTMRRRGGRGNWHDSYGGSIRSAIRLSAGHGKSTEKIGKAIDAVDSFSVQTGMCCLKEILSRWHHPQLMSIPSLAFDISSNHRQISTTKSVGTWWLPPLSSCDSFLGSGTASLSCS